MKAQFLENTVTRYKFNPYQLRTGQGLQYFFGDLKLLLLPGLSKKQQHLDHIEKVVKNGLDFLIVSDFPFGEYAIAYPSKNVLRVSFVYDRHFTHPQLGKGYTEDLNLEVTWDDIYAEFDYVRSIVHSEINDACDYIGHKLDTKLNGLENRLEHKGGIMEVKYSDSRFTDVPEDKEDFRLREE